MATESFGNITGYYKGSFFGTDAGSKEITNKEGEKRTFSWNASAGLTQWVANNFEVLGFGTKPPTEDRRVNKGNRSQWARYAQLYLNRLFNSSSQRKYVLRRSMEYNNKNQWELFPDLDEAKKLNLIGMNGDLPVAVVNIETARWDPSLQWLIFSYFDSKIVNKVDVNDIVFSSGLSVENTDDLKLHQRVAFSNSIASTMRGMMNTKKEVNNRLADWSEYLDSMYEANRNNEWGAQILSIEVPTRDSPEYVLKLRCTKKIYDQINSRRNRGGRLYSITSDHSESEDEWKRKEDSQNHNATRGDTKDAGKYLKVRGQPTKSKDGMVEFFLRVQPPVEDNPTIGLKDDAIGSFLINDVSRDLIQIDRQRKGIERLQELEADNNVHDWLFDINKAAKNPRNLPLLEHEPLSPLNEEQERAVRGALAAPDVFLIQGPPGTGKTTVIAEIINQATESGGRVLLASQSNLAVDNALGRFANTPNIRPIRRYAQSAEVDPEAEKFLEGNVIKDFFVPSIRQHCETEQAESERLLAAKQAIINALQALPTVLAEIENEANNLKMLLKEKDSLMSEIDDQNMVRERQSRQRSALEAVLAHLRQNTLEGITKDLTDAAGLDHSEFALQQRVMREKEEEEVRDKILEVLAEPPLSAPASPTILRLEAEKDDAIEQEDYLRAQEIKLELEKERQNAPDTGTDWISWTKQLSRLNGRLQEPSDFLDNLTKQLEQPDSLDSNLVEIVDRQWIRWGESETPMPLEDLQDLVQDKLQATESSMESQKERIKAIEESAQSNLASTERCKRKHADAIQHCQTLLAGLPDEVSEDASIDTGVDLSALNLRADAWMLENNSSIEADSIWRNIRSDWLDDLENPQKSTLQDLETMYTQMVNVEGVTTSFAGKFAWYNQHLKAPFDIVIIDEISKATPPEILLPILLGKKAILVGDHRQLPPTFKDPTSKSREEVQADEIEDERFSRGGKFERMVTAALFAEYFKEAHDSLKVTLLKQYRMHRQIMKSTNEFYEGKLECGLPDEDQKRLKQHGFHLKKKDSGGTFNLEGSDLITPDQHLVWVDSTFDRDGNYCQETRPETTTSRRNEREVHLAKYMLDEFEEQIAAKKQEVDPAEWASDAMLRHLDHEHRLPVGFITFYADQKRAFREIANEGDSWASMRNRWPNLNVRADTVDKFQGGERPVVFVSMVTSPQVKGKGEKEIFEAKVAGYSHNPTKVSKRHGGFKNGGIPTTRTSFVRSPERINVAFSRAQNLLIILGNRFTLEQVKDVRIERDDGTVVEKSMYKNIQQTIGTGGMIDGRAML